MTQRKISTSTLLIILIVSGIPLSVFFYQALGNKPAAENTTTQSSEIPAPSTTIQPSLRQSYFDTIECAALISTMESIKNGALKAESKAFNHVSYTLGFAEELAIKSGLDKAQAKADYNKTTASLLQKLSKSTAEQLADSEPQYQRCISRAEKLNPDTLVEAAMKEAKAHQEKVSE